MKNQKTMMVCLGSVLMVASAAFVFAAPYQETSTTKTSKAKKTKTTATTATTAAPETKATKAAKTTKSETTKNATDAQIAAAKSAGQVWVNTSTKVYHDSSSQFYGATKAGKFMSEKDAIAAGHHKAKNEK
jgi:type II secretory pathway component PulM